MKERRLTHISYAVFTGYYVEHFVPICSIVSYFSGIIIKLRPPEPRKYHLRAHGFNLDRIVSRVSTLIGVDQRQIWEPGKERTRVKARSLLCYWAVRDLGIAMTELSRRLGLSLSGVGLSVRRGEILARSEGYRLIDE